MIDPHKTRSQASGQRMPETRESKPVMITGDHVITAQAIAKQLGILPKNGQVLEGTDLSKMTQEELEEVVDDVYVYAGVSSLNINLKLLKLFQQKITL